METLIKVKNLYYSYAEQRLLKDISFTIEKKEIVALLGHNGSGKSTLIKILLGILKQEKGEVMVKGRVSYIPQKYNYDVNFPGTVKEILDLECCDCELRERVLISLGIKDFVKKQFKQLSGGQQQRVLLSLSLLSNPEILILDEPTVGVDSRTQKEFYELLKKFNEERNLTILLVTHDLGVSSHYFTKLMNLDNGTIEIKEGLKNV